MPSRASPRPPPADPPTPHPPTPPPAPGPPGGTRHSPGLRPHAEQVAAAGRAGDPHGPVVLAVAPRPGPPARAPAASGGPARPHPAAGRARSPGPCPAGRRSRPRLTRAPIYSPAARPSSPAAVPPPAPADERGLRGAGGRRASREGPTPCARPFPGPRGAPGASPASGPGPREASRCAPNSRPQDPGFLATFLPPLVGVGGWPAQLWKRGPRGRCRSARGAGGAGRAKFRGVGPLGAWAPHGGRRRSRGPAPFFLVAAPADPRLAGDWGWSTTQTSPHISTELLWRCLAFPSII